MFTNTSSVTIVIIVSVVKVAVTGCFRQSMLQWMIVNLPGHQIQDKEPSVKR